MSIEVRKYPAKSIINRGQDQFFFTRVYTNPTYDVYTRMNDIIAGSLLLALDRLRFVVYVGLNLASGAQVDDIIFTLSSITEGVIRRWSYAKINNQKTTPVTGNTFAYINFTIKDPPFTPGRLDFRFDVINPVYPSGTTSTLTIQIFREVRLS
jgi:hypothetical protein